MTKSNSSRTAALIAESAGSQAHASTASGARPLLLRNARRSIRRAV